MRILSLTTVFFAAAMTTGGAFARLPNLDSISIGAAQISNEMPNAAPLASNLEKRNHHNSGVDVNSASATGDVMVSHRRRHGHQSGHRAGGRTRNASLRNGHRRHRNQRNANRGEMTPFDRLMNLLHRATSLIQRSAGRTGERGVGHRRHRHQRNRAAGGHRHHGGRRHRGVGGRNRSGRGGAGRQPVPWQYHRNVKSKLTTKSGNISLLTYLHNYCP